MKIYTILITLLFVSILSSSCNKSEYEVTKHPETPYLRMWAMTACSTEFDFDSGGTVLDWEEKILDALKARNITVLTHHIGFIKQKDFIGCGNCLRTGDYIDVEVSDSQISKLRELGFGDD